MLERISPRDELGQAGTGGRPGNRSFRAVDIAVGVDRDAFAHGAFPAAVDGVMRRHESGDFVAAGMADTNPRPPVRMTGGAGLGIDGVERKPPKQMKSD